tara:strand:+ start:137 stop:547 length:411 start_codon:yes stop_codon:yes gene_type:complete
MKTLVNVVCGVLLNKNIVYLPKRATTLSDNPGCFEFPGGKIEKNEVKIDALKRELSEELSIIVCDKDIIAFPGNNIKFENIDLTCYLITHWENELKIVPGINSEIISVDIKELKNIDQLLETDKLLIKPIFEFLNI